MSNGAKSRRQSALLLATVGSDDPTAAAAFGKALAKQAYEVACLLPEGWQVLHGLLHGDPGLEHAITKLDKGVEELIVLPMHPQYSRATSGAIMREVHRILGESRRPIDIASRVLWYNDGGYVNAQARLIASFVSSMEFAPPDTHLLFVAPEASVSNAESEGDYCEKVRQTVTLVLERLGWAPERASVEFRTVDGEGEEKDPDLENRLFEQVSAGLGTIALIPIGFAAGAGLGLDSLVGGIPERAGTRVFVGPDIDTYGPFMTALKNLAVRGPRSVAPGTAGTAPLLAPKADVHVETAPGSLVMIGASMSGKVHAGHGPEVVHSPPGVFCEVKKTRKELRAFLDWVREETPVEEAFVWNTCQRIEFFGWHSDAEGVADHEWPVAEIRQHLYGAEPEGLKVNVLFGVEAWHHLMRTACGLNSALPGDTDILDQLQTSCRMGERVGTAGLRATSMVGDAVALADEVRNNTPWARFSRGFCAAALSRVHDLSGADLERCRHVVIGGSATSRSVLFNLSERFNVSSRQMTLVYRDHHGQMKLLRSAIGNGKRLRVHAYSERSVIDAIGRADFVFFGIDHSEPVISAEMVDGIRDFVARPLVVIDFNDSGSVDGLDTLKGISVWTADDLNRAVESYAEAMCADKGFSAAVEQAERWIEARLPGGDNG